MARLANMPDDLKSAALKEMENHLLTVTKERSFLRSIIDDCKKGIAHDTMSLEPHEHCSFDGAMHYSFDFAQQVHYPSDPLQPGPVYFKSLRKCGLFGVNREALGRQVNFLIDEALNCGKGANCVISLLDFFSPIMA